MAREQGGGLTARLNAPADGVEVGLAAAVVRRVLGASVFWVWFDGEQKEQQAGRKRTGEALADLLARGTAALRDNDAAQAAAALGQAERWLAEPGGDELRGRV